MSAHLITEAELDANPWASCGPIALAGLLGRPLADLRAAFPRQRPGRTWTNGLQMREALYSLSLRWATTPYASTDTTTAHHMWPRHGLVLVQFTGTWDRLRYAAQLSRTHWIAYVGPGARMHDGRWTTAPIVFDANTVGVEVLAPVMYWQHRVEGWEKITAPMLMAQLGGSDGKWWVRDAVEVSLP